MSATLYDHSTRYIELRMRELHAEAARARLGRQMRGPHPLRRRLGRLLISVGEALSPQPLQSRGVAEHVHDDGGRGLVGSPPVNPAAS